MRLSKGALGLSLGFVWGLFVLLATWWLIINDSNSYHFYMSKLGTFYLGYEVSWLGGIIGCMWGFANGFIAGFLIAWVYNTVRPKFRKYIEPERVNND
jgi:hypothetical protein